MLSDAEGRLTLADALVYADTVVKADVIVDMATLTGASMIALGENVGSLFSSSDRLQQVSLQAFYFQVIGCAKYVAYYCCVIIRICSMLRRGPVISCGPCHYMKNTRKILNLK